MIENETKGWHGSYSLAGKHSAEKYNNIIHKNEILRGETRKVKIRDMFTPDEPKHDILEDNPDLFKLYSLDNKILENHKKDQKRKAKKKDLKYEIENSNFKYFFHNKHCSTNSKLPKRAPFQPGCTRYNPNYNYIWPKLLTGPKWKDVLGRKQKKREIDKRDFVINNLENYDKYVINNGDIKCFVNMNKTTQRGNFIENKDLRIRTDRPFSKNSKSKDERNLAYELTDGAARTYINCFYKSNNLTESNKNKKKSKNNIKNIQIEYLTTNKSHKNNKEFKINLINRNLINRNLSNEIKENHLTEDDNYQKSLEDSKSINYRKKRNLKSFYIDSEAATVGTSEQIKYKIKNSAPDFSKLISREEREKVRAFRKDNIPFIVPNYSYVRERPIVTAIYKKKRKSSRNKNKIFLGIDSTLNYNPNSIIEKYNNHLSSKTPKFKYMVSRPNKKGSPLPFYMQQIHDRSATYVFSDKSLELNKFSEGKYIPASSTFFPKKSFNKIINVGFANSKTFKEVGTDEDILSKKLLITQKLKLSHVDYEELVNEGALNKFDNFSYKTIIKKKKKDNLNKPIMSFEVNEENN